MKTKFINCPSGQEGKQQRANLRQYGRGYLLAWSDRLAQSNFSALTFDLIYILARDGLQGYLSCLFSDTEGIRFYVSNPSPIGYWCDKIEYHYTKDGQTVSFDVTRDEGFQNLFTWLEISGRVKKAIDVANNQAN